VISRGRIREFRNQAYEVGNLLHAAVAELVMDRSASFLDLTDKMDSAERAEVRSVVGGGETMSEGGNPIGDKHRAMVAVEMWIEEEEAARTAGYVVTYTTAPSDYDWFGTKALIENVGMTTGAHPKTIRKVHGPADLVEAQRGRYGSGLHMAADEIEWKKLVDYKLVTVLP
jgi:hypothetical protein